MTAVAAVVVRTGHAPHIIDGTTHAASLGKPDLTCRKCNGSGREPYGYVGSDAKMYGFPCRFGCINGTVALPDGPTDLVLIAANGPIESRSLGVDETATAPSLSVPWSANPRSVRTSLSPGATSSRSSPA